MKLNLTVDELLTTTRSVRKRLDLERPVEQEVLEECLHLALQAPTASNSQPWHFVVVRDNAKKMAIAELYRKAWSEYLQTQASAPHLHQQDSTLAQSQKRVVKSALYLSEVLHQVPVLVIPCMEGRPEKLPMPMQAAMWGSLYPAMWSFMLAARERGLGTTLTTLHLTYEKEVAEILGIPYEKIAQGMMTPLAYTQGTEFKPAPRRNLEDVLHVDGW